MKAERASPPAGTIQSKCSQLKAVMALTIGEAPSRLQFAPGRILPSDGPVPGESPSCLVRAGPGHGEVT